MFWNPLFNSLIEEETLYLPSGIHDNLLTHEKDHRKCLGISKKFSWSRSELLRFNCIIVERSLTELFMIIFLRWWDSNQRAAIYSDTPSASLYHKQARNGCTYMRYVPRHFKDNIVVVYNSEIFNHLLWMRHIQSLTKVYRTLSESSYGWIHLQHMGIAVTFSFKLKTNP